MPLNRSLGGIGRLYSNDLLLGEVYYNIRQGQSPAQLVCSVVFVGNDVDLPNATLPYLLLLEDGHELTVNLYREHANSPYVCPLQAEMLNSEVTSPPA